jgi:hypothetical protein
VWGGLGARAQQNGGKESTESRKRVPPTETHTHTRGIGSAQKTENAQAQKRAQKNGLHRPHNLLTQFPWAYLRAGRGDRGQGTAGNAAVPPCVCVGVGVCGGVRVRDPHHCGIMSRIIADRHLTTTHQASTTHHGPWKWKAETSDTRHGGAGGPVPVPVPAPGIRYQVLGICIWCLVSWASHPLPTRRPPATPLPGTEQSETGFGKP